MNRVDVHAQYLDHSNFGVCIRVGNVKDWVPWRPIAVRNKATGRQVKTFSQGQDIIVNMPETLARQKGFV